MKTFLTAIILMCVCTFGKAQSDSRFYDTESSYKQNQELNTDPGGGGLGGGDAPAAPIDGYLPVLLIAALGLAAYYGRKQAMPVKQ